MFFSRYSDSGILASVSVKLTLISNTPYLYTCGINDAEKGSEKKKKVAFEWQQTEVGTSFAPFDFLFCNLLAERFK